jgi:hypothetical protein
LSITKVKMIQNNKTYLPGHGNNCFQTNNLLLPII